MKKLLLCCLFAMLGMQLNADPILQEQFYEAIRNCDVKAVQKLIKQGVNVKERDKGGIAPIYFTIRNYNDDCSKHPKESFKIAEILLNNGVSVNEKTYDETILHTAVLKRNLGLAKLLIKKGADINMPAGNKSTPLHSAIFNNDNMDIVKLLVEHGADVNAQDEYGRTPLHYVQTKEMAEYLVTNGANIYIKDKYDLTPFHTAYNKEILSFFLSKVRDVDMLGFSSITPLQHQLKNQWNTDMVNLLLEHNADVNAKDIYGTPVLAYAQNKEMIDLLVSKGAKTDNLISAIILNDTEAAENFIKTNLYRLKGPQSYNALYYAVKAENFKIAKMLIERGADVNNKSSDGRTPLHEAALTGNLKMVKLLVKNGADVNAEIDGINPLYLSIFGEKNKDNKVLKYLISKGADVNTRNGSLTLLWLAAHDGMAEAVKILLENGASLNPPPNSAASPIMAALSDKDLKTTETILKLMIKHGADMNMKRPYTPFPLLYSTISNNQLDLAKLLVKLGAKVNSDPEISKFYVANAVRNNNKDMIIWLLENNAGINAVDYSGKSALDYAQTDDMKQLLISHGAKSSKDLKNEEKK